MKYKVAIIGATGLVGRTVLKVLEENSFPHVYYSLFSSSNSSGKKIPFLGENYTIYELTDKSFEYNFDFAIFCANGEISKKYIPIATKSGCIAIDNSSVFRMNPDVPLVIPEVNPEDIFKNKGIIANPNCSTIQAVLVLNPLDNNYGIKRIVYSTYQAVSGAGYQGLEDLEKKSTGNDLKKFPYSIYDNCIPHIDSFMDNGYTKEEYKMINETRKILHNPGLKITSTAVRVPIPNCHCECVNIELKHSFDIYDIRILLQNSPGIIVTDNPEKNRYPLACKANGNDEVFVGRIRRDFSIENGINLWIVADNLRKGAATNAVQILEKLIK